MNRATWQGVRYLLVGSFNVGFTLAVFWILNKLYAESLGVQGVYWISAVTGVANGFLWQRLLVWRSRNQWHAEFARFIAANAVISVANSALLFVAVDLADFQAFPSQVVITAILVTLSFIMARSWVFRRARVPGDSEQSEAAITASPRTPMPPSQ